MQAKQAVILVLSLMALFHCAGAHVIFETSIQPIQIKWVIKLSLRGYEDAFNPSLVRTTDGFLLTFRHLPDPAQSSLSDIMAVLLDETFKPIGEPQKLNTRTSECRVRSQSEDARVFRFQENIYIIYNDNTDTEGTSAGSARKRNMYLSKLYIQDGLIRLEQPLMLRHANNHSSRPIEKNWSPFEWNGHLLLSYTISPHEVLRVDLESGICEPIYRTSNDFCQRWGQPRGGTPAQLMQSQYLSLSHSWIYQSSWASGYRRMPHYYMQAYIFSPDPPFEIRQATSHPLVLEGMYTPSGLDKRVIYPAGLVVDDNCLYVSYGKDDHEIWIAKIALSELQARLQPVCTID